MERKSNLEMVGELLREAGLLIVVFVPVDSAIELQRSGLRNVGWLLSLFALGVGCIILGVFTERRRNG